MKLKLFSFVLVLFILSPGWVNASEDEAQYTSMEQMMGAIRLEKKQVESMVDKMVDSGRISPEEGVKAKREIASMKDDDLENLKTRAMAEVKSQRLLDR